MPKRDETIAPCWQCGVARDMTAERPETTILDRMPHLLPILKRIVDSNGRGYPVLGHDADYLVGAAVATPRNGGLVHTRKGLAVYRREARRVIRERMRRTGLTPFYPGHIVELRALDALMRSL